MAVGNWAAPNPVTQWLYDNFDPAVAVAQLRAAGIAPETTEWWRTDMTAVYEALPSPLPILRAHVRMVTVDSRDCPGMAQALAVLDRRALDWRLALPTVGEDRERLVAFHDIHTVYTLNLLLPGLHGSAAVEASGPQIEALVGPVLAAAAACEKSPA